MTTIINTLADAKRIAGNLGTRNAKMPGPDYSISPSRCLTGAKLATIPGSTCAGCYAISLERAYPSARKGWNQNLDTAVAAIALDADAWARAMAFQIKWQCAKLGEDVMRWFGAGDLQSVDMLRAIIRVCELTPHIRHWLPTREATIVRDWRKAGGQEPDNLVIRISATMIGDAPRNAPHTSTVHRHGETVHGHACPANSAAHRATNDGKASCADCRACWSRDVANVSYPFH
ncbi:MAG TPA: hypothetical protein VJN66_08600 [Rhodanobacteraceae bacterium]|nr:hypothetical protein [Rhodanobacteraceae bacterium]